MLPLSIWKGLSTGIPDGAELGMLKTEDIGVTGGGMLGKKYESPLLDGGPGSAGDS